jgi:myo-inositol 2-dehydrogenase / D-chiro-inositol 1-dehydrogenase
VSAGPPRGPVRIGLVGAGRWAQAHRATFADAGAELVAVATGSEARAAEVRALWGVAATTDLAELLAADVEAVVIASPNDLHAEQAVRALAAGKHVLIEKPMAIDRTAARRVVDAARGSDRVVAVGHEMRVFQLYARVRRLIDAGRVGQPLHLRLDLWRRPHRAGASGWKRDPARLGSAELEETIHFLDLARWYLGEPSDVLAWGASRRGERDRERSLDVRLRFASDAAGGDRWALLTSSTAAAGYSVDLSLVGAEASVRGSWRGRSDVDPDPEVRLVLHHAGGDEEQAVPSRSGHAHDLVRQTRAFVDAIRRGTPVPADVEDGRRAVELALLVAESRVAGRAMTVPA